jgi:hypothetical protein
MHRDDLVVLDRQIVARRLEVRNLVLGGYGRVGWHAAAPDGAEHDRRNSREYIRVLHEYTHSDSTFGVPRECSGDRSGMQRANVQVCARAKHITAVPASQPWPPDHLTISASGHTHPHRHRTRIAIAVALLCAAG